MRSVDSAFAAASGLGSSLTRSLTIASMPSGAGWPGCRSV
jgi:hypothetical protein